MVFPANIMYQLLHQFLECFVLLGPQVGQPGGTGVAFVIHASLQATTTAAVSLKQTVLITSCTSGTFQCGCQLPSNYLLPAVVDQADFVSLPGCQVSAR
jgi:hypothetical protein